jgi:hypothetical protein
MFWLGRGGLWMMSDGDCLVLSWLDLLGPRFMRRWSRSTNVYVDGTVAFCHCYQTMWLVCVRYRTSHMLTSAICVDTEFFGDFPRSGRCRSLLEHLSPLGASSSSPTTRHDQDQIASRASTSLTPPPTIAKGAPSDKDAWRPHGRKSWLSHRRT